MNAATIATIAALAWLAGYHPRHAGLHSTATFVTLSAATGLTGIAWMTPPNHPTSLYGSTILLAAATLAALAARAAYWADNNTKETTA